MFLSTFSLSRKPPCQPSSKEFSSGLRLDGTDPTCSALPLGKLPSTNSVARTLFPSHRISPASNAALQKVKFPDATVPKAEALRRSMLALMARTDKPYFAHPAFWAPFVLVGEGSGIRR